MASKRLNFVQMDDEAIEYLLPNTRLRNIIAIFMCHYV